jgi:hypothetical protein
MSQSLEYLQRTADVTRATEGEDVLVLQSCDVVSHPRTADISFTPLRKYKNSLMGKYARNSRKKKLKEYRAPETNKLVRSGVGGGGGEPT